MSNTPKAPLSAKEQIAYVRESRGPVTAELLKRNKDQNQAQRAILATIATEAKTVPEIAQETGLDTAYVLWIVSGLRKYNKAESVKKRDDYMTYRKKEGGE